MKRLLAILLSSALLLALMTAVAAGDSTGPYTASISSGNARMGRSQSPYLSARKRRKATTPFG